jgi:hypothetical protein
MHDRISMLKKRYMTEVGIRDFYFGGKITWGAGKADTCDCGVDSPRDRESCLAKILTKTNPIDRLTPQSNDLNSYHVHKARENCSS